MCQNMDLYIVYEEELLTAFNEKSRIGWKHLILGRISTKWAVANEVVLRQHGWSNKMDATTWTAMVISLLWRYGLSNWDYRNRIVHGDGTYSTRDVDKLHKMVKAAYKYMKRKLVVVILGYSTNWN
jgi:hypothetical protein